MLIVHPSATQGQLQLPVGSAQMVTSTAQIVNATLGQKDDEAVSAASSAPLSRVKNEKEPEKPNDISVYDFDEGTYLLRPLVH